MRSAGRRRSCATAEPIAPPICAIGPSRPTEAPHPSDSAAPSAFEHDPLPLDPRAAEIHHLEKIRKAVAEHVARKQAVEQDHPDAAAQQHHRHQRKPQAAARDFERAPFQAQEDPGEEFDQHAEAQIAERGQQPDRRRQQNLQRVVELVSA